MHGDSAVSERGELKGRPDEAAEDAAEWEPALGRECERALGRGQGNGAPEPVRADVCAAAVDRRAEAVACWVLELRVARALRQLANPNVGRPVAAGRGPPGIECVLEEAGGPVVIDGELEAERPGDLILHLRPL